MCIRTSLLSRPRDRGVETCSREIRSVIVAAGTTAGRSRRGGAEEGVAGGTSGAERAGSASTACIGAVSRLTAGAGSPPGGGPRSMLGAICAGGDRPLVARKTSPTTPSEAADKIATRFQRRSVFASGTSGNGEGPPPRWSSRSAGSTDEIGSSNQSSSGELRAAPGSACGRTGWGSRPPPRWPATTATGGGQTATSRRVI